jgi:hypothetical protein
VSCRGKHGFGAGSGGGGGGLEEEWAGGEL